MKKPAPLAQKCMHVQQQNKTKQNSSKIFNQRTRKGAAEQDRKVIGSNCSSVAKHSENEVPHFPSPGQQKAHGSLYLLPRLQGTFPNSAGIWGHHPSWGVESSLFLVVLIGRVERGTNNLGLPCLGKPKRCWTPNCPYAHKHDRHLLCGCWGRLQGKLEFLPQLGHNEGASPLS